MPLTTEPSSQARKIWRCWSFSPLVIQGWDLSSHPPLRRSSRHALLRCCPIKSCLSKVPPSFWVGNESSEQVTWSGLRLSADFCLKAIFFWYAPERDWSFTNIYESSLTTNDHSKPCAYIDFIQRKKCIDKRKGKMSKRIIISFTILLQFST